MKRLFYTLSACLLVLLIGCVPQAQVTTRGERYAKLYQERPISIAIMPPINRTEHVDAKNFFYTTLYLPLCEKGYYVYSPYLLKDLFEQESAADAEPFLEGDLKRIGEIVGADACAFTIIKNWKRNNLASLITVRVEYIIRSTHTNNILFQREGELTVNNNVKTGAGGIFDLAASFINNATQDKVVAGSLCSKFIFNDLPAGKYSPNFGKDDKLPSALPFVRTTVRKGLGY